MKFNYRSGRRLIDASQAALSPDEPRHYEPDPAKQDQGEVFLFKAGDSLEDHARVIAHEIMPELLARGIPLEEIAILYRQRGRLFQAIQVELRDANVPLVAEREGKYPRTPVIRWLQECAANSITGHDSSNGSFEELFRIYHEILLSAGLIGSEPTLAARLALYESVFAHKDPSLLLAIWLRTFTEGISLREALSRAPDRADDLESLENLRRECEPAGSLATHTLADFARDARVRGKVTVTTLHSSKGRQFDVVLLPGLVEGILPRRPWDRRTRCNEEPSPQVLSEDRRLFYVGFTRARKLVFLVFSEGYTTDRGQDLFLGASRFVAEIRSRLDA